MDDYPYWAEMSLADQLWIAALEAEVARLPSAMVSAIRTSADIVSMTNELLEAIQRQHAGILKMSSGSLGQQPGPPLAK